MPQDHVSWDRKELLRQRKYERPERSFDSSFRWRDSPATPSSHHIPREFSRWGSGDFRRPSCHSKQGERHQFVEETSNGYTSSRSNTRIFENDYYRPSPSRGDWRYTRNLRDDRVSVSQKEWKYNTWEMSNGSSRGFERRFGIRDGRSSVDERLLHASDSHTNAVNCLNPASSSHQPDTEICTPVRSLKFKNEQKFSDQRLSLPSDYHSDCVSLFERPAVENNCGNKVCSPEKQCSDLIYGRRLANDSSLDPPILNAELEGTRAHLHLKDPQDNKRLRGTNDLDGAKNGAKESSLGAVEKLPPWNTSGSFASQSSGFSHSSSLKSLGGVDSSDRKTEILPKVVTVTQSSSGDAAAYDTSTHLSEEMSSRKKQRLGWGEGLAKYEKKKVDVNEDGTPLLENGSEELHSLNNNIGSEELHSLNNNITDRSPIAAIVPDYGSPTTPSSVACSSSPGFADKSSTKVVIAASDVGNVCRSPSPVSSIHPEQFPVDIKQLDNSSMERFGCVLNELLSTGDFGDSSSVLLTSMNRLLSWKSEILKAVEMTESEIDIHENKHRAILLEGGRHCHVVEPAAEFGEGVANVSKEQEASCMLGPMAAASYVAETSVRAPVHQAGLAEVPDVVEDKPGEVKSLSQTFDTVENNGDILPIPSIEAAASSKDTNSNRKTIALSSGDDSMVSSEDVLSANKKLACESSRVFHELLPSDFCTFDDLRFPGIHQTQFDLHVKEKIADRVEHLRAKEKILLLQFKAFQHSWKKDLHQLALTKSSKKREQYLNAKNGGYLKLPQPVRLRFSSSAPRKDSMVPTTELVGYMEKLLRSTHLKPLRDTLKMPAMISDEKERVMSRFISSNGLIEDPCDVEKERTMINPWTSEEKEIFLNMLAMHGKDFKKIASYLTHKTTADCIDYYYKNHKSDCFRKIKKQRAYGKEGKCTYMLTTRKKWKREMGAASLDILGAVSNIAANAGKAATTRPISSKRITLRGYSSSYSLQHDGNNSEECSYGFDFPRKRTVGADDLAVDPLSSEMRNSFSRASVNSRERCMDHMKFNPVVKKPRISHTLQNENSNEEDDSCSEESCGEAGTIHWTDDERSAFLQGLSLFGKNFGSISGYVRTRSPDQCRVFFSKVRKCLGLEFIQSGSGNVSTSVSVDNGNEGGGSEFEDPCPVESNSGICSNGVCAQMGMNSPTSPFIMNQDGADHSGSANVKANPRSEQQKGLADLHLKGGTDLVNNEYINGSCPVLVSESVENQPQAGRKSKSNDLRSVEVDGVSTSVAISSEPSYCGLSLLSDVIMETPTESSQKGTGDQSVAMPKLSSMNQDGLMQAANRTKNSVPEPETASSGFRYPECLHHVPIEVCTENSIGVSVPRENPTCHTEPKSGHPVVGQVVETHDLGWQPTEDNLELDRRLLVVGHISPKQNGQLNVNNAESCQIPQRSVTKNPSRIRKSKSDLIVKFQSTGEAWPLKKCTSSASLAVSHKNGRSNKEGRSGHSRSHSFNLSDAERSNKNGDVKLFGTVLTADKNVIEQKHNQSGSVRSSSTLSKDHDTRHHYINQQHLQNVPITSYGFWDGNRIQIGFTSLPESAKLLVSCPEAFSTQLKQQNCSSSKEIQMDVNGGILKDRTEASSATDEGNLGRGSHLT